MISEILFNQRHISLLTNHAGKNPINNKLILIIQNDISVKKHDKTDSFDVYSELNYSDSSAHMYEISAVSVFTIIPTRKVKSNPLLLSKYIESNHISKTLQFQIKLSECCTNI